MGIIGRCPRLLSDPIALKKRTRHPAIRQASIEKTPSVMARDADAYPQIFLGLAASWGKQKQHYRRLSILEQYFLSGAAQKCSMGYKCFRSDCISARFWNARAAAPLWIWRPLAPCVSAGRLVIKVRTKAAQPRTHSKSSRAQETFIQFGAVLPLRISRWILLPYRPVIC